MFFSLLLSLFLNPAHAASDELNFELGQFGAQDASWDMFSDRTHVGSWGFRGGKSLGNFTTIVLSWQHSMDGGAVGEDYDYDEDSVSFSPWYLALTTNQLAVGPKFDLEVFPWLHPYGTVQAMGWLGTVRMDEDIEDDENPNEIAKTGFAPGGIAALGLDLIPLRADRKVRPATYVEAGYGYALPMKVGDLGEVQFSGFYLHWGVGARF